MATLTYYVDDAALALATPTANDVAITSSYNTPGDGGGGTWLGFVGSPGTFTGKNGLVVIPTGGDGSAAWIRQYSGPVDVRWFGAKGNNSTDDSDALQEALDVTGDVYIPPGAWKTTKTLEVPPNTNVFGAGQEKTYIVSHHCGICVLVPGTVNAINPKYVSIKHMTIVTCASYPALDLALKDGSVGLADIFGLFVSPENLTVRGFEYGIVFDGTEISDIVNCDLEWLGTAGVWLTNGPDFSEGAATDFTNQIGVERCQFNSSPIGIMDDGGYSHKFTRNNYNGCSLVGVRFSGVKGLEATTEHFEGCERSYEAAVTTYVGSFPVGISTSAVFQNVTMYAGVSSGNDVMHLPYVESIKIDGGIARVDAAQFAITGVTTGALQTDGFFVYGGGEVVDEEAVENGRVAYGRSETILGWLPSNLKDALQAWWEPSRGLSLGTTMRASGTTPPGVTLTGTLTDQRPLRIEITTGGARGTAIFRWSMDGSSWVSGVTTAATVALTGTGLDANFAAGTYATNNVYQATAAALVDQSSRGNDLTQASSSAQLVVLPAAANGRAALQGASSQWIQSASLTSAIQQPCTWYLAGHWPSGSGGRYLLDSSGANRQAIYESFGGTAGGLDFYAGSAEISTPSQVPYSTDFIARVVFRATSSHARIEPDGQPVITSYGSPGANAIDNVVLLRSTGGGAEFTGRFYAAFCVLGELSAEVDAYARGYLQRRFGISAT